MSAEEFNDQDPWHSNANLLFGFGCIECFENLDMVFAGKVGEGGPEFLAECVRLSKQAQTDGWTLVDEWMFLCPTCTQKRRNSSAYGWRMLRARM